MNNIIISPYLSYMEKNLIFALYINFGYFFLKGISASYFRMALEDIEEGCDIRNSIPKSFISFLLKKEIFLEVNNEGN